jgi:hypothetical protein
MDGKMAASLTLICANQKSNREESSASGDDDKKKDKQAAQILLLRSLAHLALRRHQNCQPIKRDDNGSERIPTCNCCTREPNMSARGKEHRPASGQTQDDTLTRVLTTDKIDNAHLCIRGTNIRQQWQAGIAARIA